MRPTALVVLSILAGCKGGDDPWIELGTGLSAFEPLEDAGTIELVQGVQGGWHVDTALRFGGFGPDGVRLQYRATDVDGAVISYTTEAFLSEALVRPFGDEGFERLGDRVVFDIPSADTVIGQTVILEVLASEGDLQLHDDRTLGVVDLE
ncbi:MAG: hypothetical protein H6737_14915 [Alphaproteobacteria bacterium]|nr:hypothetical protein [Alphaproteobacteria bacterium]